MKFPSNNVKVLLNRFEPVELKLKYGKNCITYGNDGLAILRKLQLWISEYQ